MTLRLSSRIALLFVLAATVLVAIVGVLAYRSGSESLEQAAVTEVLGTAIEKEALLDQWLDEHSNDLRGLALDPDLVEKAARLVATRPGSDAWRAAREQVLTELRPHQSGPGSGFVELFVMEPDRGAVLVSTLPGEEGKEKVGHPYFDHGRTGFYVQGPYNSVDVGTPIMTAAMPLLAVDGRAVAVLAGRLDLAAMNAIVQRRTGLRQTDDTFLVNAGRFPVTQPRFIEEPVVLRRRLDTEAVRRCVARDSGVMLAPDYRGVPSIAVCRWSDRHQLGLIVKVDQAEALAPAHALGRTIAAVGGLALLVATGIALLLARSITRPLRALQDRAQRFAGTGAAAPLPESGDELGLVAREFNRMAARVSQHTAELRESQSFATSVADTSTCVIYVFDLETRRSVYSNRSAAEPLGYSQAQVLELGDKLLPTIMHPDDLPKIARVHAQLAQAADGQIFEVEYRLKAANGEWRWLWARESVFKRRPNGAAWQVMGTALDITERKRAEDAARDERAFTDALIESMPGTFCVIDPARRYVRWNQSLQKLLGLTDAQMAQTSALAVFDDATRPLAEQGIAAAFETGSASVELPATARRGSRDYVLTSTRIDTSKGPFIINIGHDLTERRRAEEALRASEERFRTLTLATSDVAWHCTAAGECIGEVSSWRAFTGQSADEMLGFGWMRAIHRDDIPRMQEQWARAAAARVVFEPELRIRRHDGQYRDFAVRGVPIQNADGTIREWVGTCADVTARKQAEQALQQANRELRALVDANQIAAAVIQSAAEGVMVTDAALKIESVNPAFEAITGFPAGEAVGHSPNILFSGKHDPAFFRRLHDRVNAQGHWHGEIWNRRRDGELYPQETSVNLLRDAEGRVSHYASVFSDNTAQNQLEAKLRALSSLDGLTGVGNRRSFDEVLAREWARALREQSPLSLLMTDVDFFKNYNDRLGHLQGDQCLRRVARALSGAAHRASDGVARYGGEEFAVILPATDATAAARMAEKVRAAVAALALPHGASDAAAFVTISVGVATLIPDSAAQQVELIAAADRALYEAKHAGRNRVVSAATTARA